MSYFVGSIINGIPWIIFEPLLLLLFFYPITMPRGLLIHYYFTLVLGMFCSQGFAYIISIFISKQQSILVCVISILILNLFNGVNPTVVTMNGNIISKTIINTSFTMHQQQLLWISELNEWPLVFESEKLFQENKFGWKLNGYTKLELHLLD